MTEPRDWVPDLHATGEHLVQDLRSEPDDGDAYLDAIGTLTGLNENDLVELAIILARRVVELQRRVISDAPEGPEN